MDSGVKFRPRQFLAPRADARDQAGQDLIYRPDREVMAALCDAAGFRESHGRVRVQEQHGQNNWALEPVTPEAWVPSG